MPVRRLRKRTAELEVTAFINVIVVLVPFLLSTAVFTRLSVLELSLPAQSSAVEQLKVDDLKLEIVIRPDALEVGDRIGGLIQRIPATSPTEHDLAALSTLMQMIKGKFPDTTTATVLAQPDTPYEMLVQVMDAVRETLPPPRVKGQHVPDVPRTVLFPDISIGDAPVSVARK
ncbi:MAG: biopolymer transporter ExbD [Piscinibacter sp.]|nr:biopolymer transporter ExbD [Piscinibacter sp.]